MPIARPSSSESGSPRSTPSAPGWGPTESPTSGTRIASSRGRPGRSLAAGSKRPASRLPSWRAPTLLLQHAMDELDADRAFADRRRDPLDARSAHVTYCEHAGAIGLEQVRRAAIRVGHARQVSGAEIGSCLD